MERSDEQVLTVREVAKEMRVSEKRVRDWIKSGELAAIDLGKDYRIYRSDLDEFIRNKRTGR